MWGMKTLDVRPYKEVIKTAVAAERKADPNWSWGIRNLKKGIVLISWGYLDYIGVKDCFTVQILQDEITDEITVLGESPADTTFYRFIGPKHWHDAPTVEAGITSAIHSMAAHAHRVY